MKTVLNHPIPLPNNNVVQTKAQLARGRKSCMLPGAAGFSRQHMLATLAGNVG